MAHTLYLWGVLRVIGHWRRMHDGYARIYDVSTAASPSTLLSRNSASRRCRVAFAAVVATTHEQAPPAAVMQQTTIKVITQIAPVVRELH